MYYMYLPITLPLKCMFVLKLTSLHIFLQLEEKSIFPSAFPFLKRVRSPEIYFPCLLEFLRLVVGVVAIVITVRCKVLAALPAFLKKKKIEVKLGD